METENTNVPKHRKRFVRFEVFTAVTMKNAVFWDITCGSCENRRLEGEYRLLHQGYKNRRAGNFSSKYQWMYGTKKDGFLHSTHLFAVWGKEGSVGKLGK
jgi:hypothetical protein